MTLCCRLIQLSTPRLHLFFNTLLPEVLNRIFVAAQSAVSAGKWQQDIANKTTKLGIRCIEFLDYSQNGGLGWHQDSDSIYTMSIMLS